MYQSKQLRFRAQPFLALLLGAHPDIATVGELSGLIARSDPDTYLCSCGERIKNCQFWKSVDAAIVEKGHTFDIAKFDTRFDFSDPRPIQRLREGSLRSPWIDSPRDKVLFSLPGERHKIKNKAERNAVLIDLILDVTGKRIFVDLSKSRMRIRVLRRFSTMDVRAIHLVRRAEGVVASQLRRNLGMEVAQPARDWMLRHHRLDTTLQPWLKDKYIRIRYEDICQEPAITLKRLFQFCGISTDVSDIRIDASGQHVIGNPMRLKPLSELKLDERWRTELTSGQLDQIDTVAGKINRRYGYV